MLAFNWIDYAMLVILGFSMLTGFARGVVREIISFVTFILALVVAILFASPLAHMLTSTALSQHPAAQEPLSYIAIGLSFALLFVSIIAIGAIIGVIINLIFKAGLMDFANRLSGAVFGFFRGCLIDLVIIFLVQLTSFNSAEAWQQSQFVTALQPAILWLWHTVLPDLAHLEEI